MQSDDPDFETKAADVIGLYVNPPDHAGVLPSMKRPPLRRLTVSIRSCRCRPAARSGTGSSIPPWYLSLLAALDTKSGEVLGQTVPRHTSAAFVDFLGDIVTTQPKGRQIHVIADNLSTHKTHAVRTFLVEHPNVHLHFTPTYSSWLNQIELWFAKIERDLLARGVFTSVADLARKIRRYIRHYNKTAKPVRWSYRNPVHRISSTQQVQATRLVRCYRRPHGSGATVPLPPLEGVLLPSSRAGRLTRGKSTCVRIRSRTSAAQHRSGGDVRLSAPACPRDETCEPGPEQNHRTGLRHRLWHHWLHRDVVQPDVVHTGRAHQRDRCARRKCDKWDRTQRPGGLRSWGS